MKRIGIMGGTFNPIHNGHLTIAEQAREQFLLDKVLFIPSGVPYMKDLQAVLPVHTRCAMTAAAIAEKPYFELSDIEAVDAAQGKNTYTYETLQKLKSADPDAVYYFILGADSLYDMEHWKNPDLIFQYCTVLAAVRGEEKESSMRQKLAGQIQYLREKYHASIAMLEMEG
ncbi:MAG: nicotinate-nucleotide adenylyltransferase, partial [Lachnospiraceae bacterium]|nr:nicotinate-nucleotide adenylyltransferase [Lachnospiraceae bacterium]